MDAWHEIAMSLRGAYLAMHRQAEGEFARYGITADQFVVHWETQGVFASQSASGHRTATATATVTQGWGSGGRWIPVGACSKWACLVAAHPVRLPLGNIFRE